MQEPPGSGAAPLVSVVVVNYNGGDDLERCLSSLGHQDPDPSAEVLVVDNASSDGSRELAGGIAAELESMRVLASPVNRGYAGAVNLAMEKARGAYVAVLNMDITVEPDWLGPLVGFLEANPGTGAVCPLLLLEADPGRINAAGQDIHVTGLGFNRWLGKPRERAGDEPMPVSGLHGGAFVIRREILDRLGGWDESGFLYAEDVQLSMLLQLIGAEIHCLPTSTVRHDYHLTMHPEKLFLLERNRGWTVLADLRAPARLALLPLFAFTELLMWGYCLLRGPAFLKAKARTYRWLGSHRAELSARRRFVASIRRRSDWQVLRRLRWGYAWSQFVTLGRERGISERNRIPTEGERAAAER
ncbi:MAG: glycosyltransferase family 2 protein [Solirubrobacterales bacterium]